MKRKIVFLAGLLMMALLIAGGFINGKSVSAACTHSWVDGTVISKATCTADGSKWQSCSKCGTKRTTTIKATGHSFNGQTVTQSATCTSNGYTAIKCSKCGTLGSKTTLYAPGHNYVDQYKATAETCTSNGSMVQKCSRCSGTTTRTIYATGHSFNGQTVTEAATCTSNGYTAIKCSKCGTLGSKTTLYAPGHNYVDQYKATAETCTSNGSMVQKCSRCSNTTTRTISATGHSFNGQTVTEAATCTADGYTAIKCSKCGTLGSKTTIAKKGHNYVDQYKVTTETCTTNGGMLQKCSRCSSTTTRTIPATGHSYTGVTKRVEPTCTTDGYSGIVCNNCGAFSSKTTISATGHKWVDQTVVTKATCTTNGAKTQKCSACGEGRTATINATGHSYTGVTRRVEPTCTTDGYSGVVCNNCGEIPSKTVIKAPGHSFTGVTVTEPASCTKDGYRAVKCNNCGEIGGKVTITATGHKWQDEAVIKAATCTTDGAKKQKCSACGEGRTTTITATGHSYTGVVRTVDATCTTDGYTGIVCNNCGNFSSKTTIIAPGHSMGKWIVDKEATCTASGTKHRTCTRTGCNETETETILSPGHSFSGVTVTEPATCAKEGYTAVKCNNCSELGGKVVIPVKEHTWKDESVVNKATCTTDGAKKQKCSVCGAGRTVTIPATGHSYTGVVKTVAATCTTDGYSGVQCNNCGEVPSKNIIKATGHSFTGVKETVAATCTTDGYTAIICNKCGESGGKTTITATGHKWQDESVVKKATCTENGAKKQKCTACGAGATVTIPALGHSYTGVVKTVDSTCTTAGYKGVVCNNCGTFSSKTEIPVKEHKWQDQSVVKKATCTEDGAKLQKCSACGEGRTITISATGHSYTGVIKKVDATCTTDGYSGVQCNNCGDVPSKKIIKATGHSFTGVKETVAATCTTDGYTAIICNKCGESGGKTSIPATGHKWQDQSTVKKATCTEDGAKLQKCSVCGEGRTITISAIGHSYTGVIKKVDATCTTDGYSGVQCNNCGEVPSKKVIKATGHSFSGVKETVDPTCTKDGYTAVVCNKCGESGGKIDIPATGHTWQTQSVVKKATCTEGGAELQVCKNCSSKQTVTTDALGHSYTGVVKVKHATCIETGYEGIQCNNCGEIAGNKKILPKTDHNLGEWVFDETESIGGKQVYVRECQTPGCNYSEKGELEVDIPIEDVPSIDKDHYITYYPNGGTGSSFTIYFKGKEASVEQNIFKKTGYYFDCWNLQSDGASLSYNPGDIIDKEQTDKLYAQWLPITYYIDFEINNYNAKKPGKITTVYDYDTWLPVPKLDGYEFLGWKGYIDGKPVYYPAAELNNPVRNLTSAENVTIYLTAEWKQNADHVSVSLYDGTTLKDKIELDKGDKAKLPSIKKYDCANLGWTTKVNGKTVEYNNGDKITVNKSMSLYAVWGSFYEVKFYDGDKLLETKGAGVGKTLKTLGKQTKNGKTSKGWSTQKFGEVEYSNSKAYSFGKDTTLYAVWDKYTVTYNANGGTGAPASQTAYQCDPLKLTKSEPSKKGYSFRGWSLTPGEDQNVDYESGSEYTLGLTKTLYAVWRPNTYTVKYDMGYAGSNASTKKATYDLSFSLKTPTRTGYTFTGWKGVSEGKPVYYSAAAVKTTMVKNLTSVDKGVVTLTAQWEKKDNYCTVTFYDGSKKVSVQAVEKGKKLKMPTYYVNDNCVDGWATKKNGTTVDYKVAKKVTINSDISLYAVWNTITVNFDANGGVGAPAAVSGPKSGFVLPSTPPTRDGYRFAGWGTRGNQEWEITVHFQPGDTYDFGFSTTLVAVWDEIIYSPLKQKLQDLYGTRVMKDVYFTTAYTSSSWQSIPGTNKYFIIKTDTTNACYDTVAFVIYKDGDTIKLDDYGSYEGIITNWKTHFLETHGNVADGAFKITMDVVGAVKDVGVGMAKTAIKGAITIYVPGGAALVAAYDTASFAKDTFELVQEWVESPMGGETIFDTVSYHVGNADTLELDFITKSDIPYSEILDIVGYVKTGVEIYCNNYWEIHSVEEANLDPYGDRDYALATFMNRIQGEGFGSNIAYSELRDIVSKLYN